MDIYIKQIKFKLQNNQFELSWHAEKEKQEDEITYSEIDQAIENIEIIEDYPNDPRGRSCLILGFTRDNRSLHFVLGNLDGEKILIITMYRPNPDEWVDFRTRR